MATQLAHFVETFRGSSFPTRCVSAEGENLVIKLRGSGNGSEALICEYLVNRLASRSGLPVPDVCIIEIDDDYPWNYGTDEFYDLVQKSGGANLGIELIEGAKAMLPNDVDSLSRETISQIVTLDLVFVNLDRSAASGNLVADSAGNPWIIDHGSCRFLFRANATKQSCLSLTANHLFAHRVDAIESRWLHPMRSGTLVSETVAELPEQWLLDAHITRAEVLQRLRDTLDCCSGTRAI